MRRSRTPSAKRPRWADFVLAWLGQVADDKALTAFTLRVALAITRHGPGACVVSYGALMRECRASDAGVRKAVAALKAHGHLESGEPGTRARATVYRLDLHPTPATIELLDRAAAIARSRPEWSPDGATGMAGSGGHGATRVTLSMAGWQRAALHAASAEEERLLSRMGKVRRAALLDARIRDRKEGGR